MSFGNIFHHGAFASAVVATSFLGLVVHVTDATLAAPFPVEMYQEDGTSMGKVQLYGGPREHYFETDGGWTICKGNNNEEGGRGEYWYYCGEAEDGDILPRLDLPVGKSDPERAGLPKKVKKSKTKMDKDCEEKGPEAFCNFKNKDGRGKKGDSKKESNKKSKRALESSTNTQGERKRVRGGNGNSKRNERHLGEPSEQELREERDLQITSGELRNLVVIFKFSDHATRSVPSKGDIDLLMNSANPVSVAPTGSVKQVFLDNSGGDLILESTVADWVTIDYTEAYCTNGESGLTERIHVCLKNALEKVDQSVDFNYFNADGGGNTAIDAITFLHSGYGAEWGGNNANRVWSHRWAFGFGNRWTSSEGVYVNDYHISPALWSTSGDDIGRIGVIAHETAHFLGLPDLYDYSAPGRGIGSWSLMANSWGFGDFNDSQLYPPQLDPWSKIELGWATLTTLSDDCSANNILLPTQTLNPSYTSHEYFKVEHGFPGTGTSTDEYLVVENRQKLGYDQKIPQAGILIWHIDNKKGGNNNNDEGYPGQSGFPGNNKHYRVALLPADGAYDLEKGINGGDAGDVFRAGGKNSLGPKSAENGGFPNTDRYQDGIVTETGVTIGNIQSAGNNMQFTFQSTCPDVPQATAPPTPSPTPAVATPAPTLSPTSPPTPSPTPAPACGASQFQVKLVLQCDGYCIEDNSMTLTSTTFGTLIWSVALGSFNNNQEYSYEECLEQNECYNLNLGDAYGDGLLGDSILTWEVDGAVRYNSGGFGDGYIDNEVGTCIQSTPTPQPTVSPTKEPTKSPTASPTASPTSSPTKSPTSPPTPSGTDPPTLSPTKSPTASPTSSPTKSPTKSPTASPTASPTKSPTSPPTPSPTSGSNPSCGANQFEVKLDLQCDDYCILDNSLTLTSITGTTVWTFPVGSFQNNQNYPFQACLNSNECYSLNVGDSYGDGFLNGNALTWEVGGAVRYNSGGFGNGYQDNEVGTCIQSTPTPTDPPTPSPTPPPTPPPTSTDGICTDVARWSDSDGDDCNWYASISGACSDYGWGYENDGYTANTACCSCGGGCTADVAGWKDSAGDDCNWYASTPNACSTYGWGYENDGYTANTACCVCFAEGV